MNLKHIRTLFAALVLSGFVYLNGSAQGNGLSLSLINYTVQNDSGNVNLGYTITINSTLHNDDTTTFTGQIQFGLHNNQQLLTNTGNIFNQPPYTGQQIYLNPGESVPAIFSIKVDDPYFLPGPDVVVVWPISSQPAADSIIIPLYIHSPTAITNQSPEAPISYLIYPNQIILQNIPQNITVQQVRIFNVFGQVMSRCFPGGSNRIPVGDLPHGIYICLIETSNHERKAFKFFH